jgi:hypothetical protein
LATRTATPSGRPYDSGRNPRVGRGCPLRRCVPFRRAPLSPGVSRRAGPRRRARRTACTR